jgi:hypothetical protein
MEKPMKRQKKLTRRETLKLSSAVAAGSLLATCAPAAASASVLPTVAPAAPAVPAAGKEATFAVVSPLGESTAKMITMAPRLDTLEGKTICMVWNGLFKGEVTLPIMAEWLKKKYPTAKVIPYTEMPKEGTWLPWPAKTEEDLAAVFKEKGCQAVISGNGG